MNQIQKNGTKQISTKAKLFAFTTKNKLLNTSEADHHAND